MGCFMNFSFYRTWFFDRAGKAILQRDCKMIEFWRAPHRSNEINNYLKFKHKISGCKYQFYSGKRDESLTKRTQLLSVHRFPGSPSLRRSPSIPVSPVPRFPVSICLSRSFASELCVSPLLSFHTLLPLKNKICPGSATILVIEILAMILVIPVRCMAVFQVLQNRQGSIFNANRSTV